MRKILIACTIAMSFAAADAKIPVAAKEPPPAAVTHAGKICSTTGGFGRTFTRQTFGHVDATADDDWAPFEKLVLEGGDIRATASFRGTGDSAEADAALAAKFVQALDKAVTAKGKFPHREARGGHIFFNTAKKPGTGLSFAIHRDGDSVMAICTDLER